MLPPRSQGGGGNNIYPMDCESSTVISIQQQRYPNIAPMHQNRYNYPIDLVEPQLNSSSVYAPFTTNSSRNDCNTLHQNNKTSTGNNNSNNNTTDESMCLQLDSGFSTSVH